MENCSKIDGTKPCRNPFRFTPPPSRRPLMSDTYRTLLRILSHCPTSSEPQPVQEKQDEIGAVESGNQTTTDGKLIDQHVEAEITSVNNIDGEKNNTHAIWQEISDITDAQLIDCINLLDHTDDSIEVNAEVLQKNGANNEISGSLVDNEQDSTLVFQLHTEQGDQSNIPELQVGESDLAKPQNMDTEISIREACATINSCLFMDTEFSELVQSDEEKIHDAEMNLLEDIEHGLQLQEMELQNLISSAGPANLSVCETAAEEIEEGEISGDNGVGNESDSCMFEETSSLEQGLVHVSIEAEKEFIHDVLDTRLQEKHLLTSFSNDPADGCSNLSKESVGKKSKEAEENDFEMVVCKNGVETKKFDLFDNDIDSEMVINQIDGVKKADRSAACLPLKTISLENATEKQDFVTETEVEDAHKIKNKKKRGPITEVKKANRKRKKKIKRAEKNRKLGVKRLKLPTIVKTKPVSYCHHYMKGRCHEGEKCKFSHDIIPLTKSKPCCHFARHSCMKGDDCPYDHQLSKYPCNNIVSKGFCNRGADCLFSHKVPATTESSKTPAVSMAQLESSPLSPKMQVNDHGSSQIFPGKSTPQTVGKSMQKLAMQAPKGVSFLSHGKVPVGDTKHNEAGSSVKEGDSGKSSLEDIHSKSDNTQNPNDVIKRPSPSIPQGINFLSFGRAPLADSTSKTMSNLLNRDCKIGNFWLGEFGKGKEAAASSPKSGDICRIEMKASCNESSLRSVNQTKVETPLKSTPRGISLLSFGKASPNGISSKNQSIFSSKEYTITSPVAHERRDSLSRLNGSGNTQFKLVSSSSPSNQLSGQSTVEHSVGLPNSTFLANMPSSAQKALQSTLAFSAKFSATFESGIKLDQSIGASVATSHVKEHH